MHTAEFHINIPSSRTARGFHPEDIELGMDAETGVKSRAAKDSMTITVTVPAKDAGDAAAWLHKMGLI